MGLCSIHAKIQFAAFSPSFSRFDINPDINPRVDNNFYGVDVCSFLDGDVSARVFLFRLVACATVGDMACGTSASDAAAPSSWSSGIVAPFCMSGMTCE